MTCVQNTHTGCPSKTSQRHYFLLLLLQKIVNKKIIEEQAQSYIYFQWNYIFYLDMRSLLFFNTYNRVIILISNIV